MKRLTCQADLDASLERLQVLDPRLVPHVAACQPIALRQRPAGLAGLIQIVLAQQVSVASAQAIWSRFEAAFPGCEVDALASADEEALRACSLSRPKIKTVMKLAGAIRAGFDLDGLADLPEDEAHKKLVGLHGIGPWTAEIYLLFCLGSADVFPAGDLALQVAVAHVLGLDQRPSEKQLANLASELWSPERGAAAHLFWAIYRDLKAGRDGVL
ncbi:DNA-3-methyladenine glycosylase II [Cohaesibacter sp. ES.047]|uniref:DNA-3-methyladenine glycosylase family protein n=1 Tax=Cohaesibacter sp. ES.047 TaxID=1798205 RepID=UPI000BB743FB|nr:DNA-3-methyladenine glycosylase [Cohaesibacter sp. ES.047]SNY90830.1 DNA-3-methyladenine glycosylase II [Cohaesibacter sp. ES.047]